MDLIAWLLLLVLVVLWFRLRQRVGRLERQIDVLHRAEPPARPAAAPVVERAPAVVVPAAPLRVAAPPAIAPEPPIRERAPDPEPEQPRTAAHRIGFEDIFGRYLPIWAGGITLIVAGVLIVKYSIDAGLLSPAVRVVAGLLFGGALVGGAEAALRFDAVVRDRRIAQSLAGAGVATLYAAILIAANLYHLVSPGTAFAGLAAVTVLAAGLSLRFGMPSAVLGLIGGLAAPALVGAQSPNVPLLAIYLALIVGGLAALARSQRWPWLGALSIVGGFGWSLVLLIGGIVGTNATLAVGLFIMLLAIAFPLLLAGEQTRVMRLVAALAGCAQMAALVATGGFTGLDWALYALISAAMIWLSRREALLADAPLAGLVVGVLLVLAWPQPGAILLAAVIAGGTAIHGGPALWRLWRAEGRLSDAAQLAIAAAAVALAPLYHFHVEAGDALLSALAVAGAAIAGSAAALGWRNQTRTGDARFALLALTSILLALVAATYWLTEARFASGAAAAALVALLLGRRAADWRIEIGAQTIAIGTLLSLGLGHGGQEFAHALGTIERPIDSDSLLRWAITAMAAIGFARWSSHARARQIGEGTATALGYVAAGLIVAVPELPLIPAAALIALAFARPRLLVAMAVAGVIAAGWTIQPLLQWLGAGALALVGEPVFVTALPTSLDALFRLGAPAIALGVLLWRRAAPDHIRVHLMGGLAVLATIALHMLWKQLFAIATLERFVAWGMAERSLWEVLLVGAGFGAWRLGQRWIALGLAGAGLAHFGWFTLLVHDPLWSQQAVGPWLLPAYATAWAATWLVVRLVERPIGYRIETGVRIGLILLFAASALRQLFHGTMLAEGAVLQAEDIARSLIAILIAIGFLYWGIRRGDRDWRIASLVLMLAAVGKVFLFDAAGLEGLLRIASFVALGLSLILVGWIYSRFLPDARLAGGQLTGAQDAGHSIDDQTRG